MPSKWLKQHARCGTDVQLPQLDTLWGAIDKVPNVLTIPYSHTLTPSHSQSLTLSHSHTLTLSLSHSYTLTLSRYTLHQDDSGTINFLEMMDGMYLPYIY